MGAVIAVIVIVVLIGIVAGFVMMLANDQRGENAKRRLAKKRLEDE